MAKKTKTQMLNKIKKFYPLLFVFDNAEDPRKDVYQFSRITKSLGKEVIHVSMYTLGPLLQYNAKDKLIGSGSIPMKELRLFYQFMQTLEEIYEKEE